MKEDDTLPGDQRAALEICTIDQLFNELARRHEPIMLAWCDRNGTKGEKDGMITTRVQGEKLEILGLVAQVQVLVAVADAIEVGETELDREDQDGA